MDKSSPLKGAGIKVRVKHDPNPEIPKSAEKPDESELGLDLMSAFFKVPPVKINSELREKLSTIYNWAAGQTGGGDELQVVNVLKNIKYRLGFPNIGDSDIDNMYRYVKIRSQAEILEAKARAMEQ